MQITTVSEFLRQQFKLRQRKNPKYSMRAFARDLKLSSGRLSEILNGVTSISTKRANEFSRILKLSVEEEKYLLNLVEIEKIKNDDDRKISKLKLSKFKNEKYKRLEEDTFKIISDWYHFAILELTYLKNFKSDINWISQKLGISETETKKAIDRLKRTQMIFENTHAKLEANEKFTESTDEIPSDVIREHHKQLIKKALSSVDDQGIDKRHLISITMGFDSSKLNKAKNVITKFAEKFNKEFSSFEENKDSVYSINIQFHQVDKN